MDHEKQIKLLCSAGACIAEAVVCLRLDEEEKAAEWLEGVPSEVAKVFNDFSCEHVEIRVEEW